MNYYEVLNEWREYADKLYPLRDDVSGTFQTKCFYDDKWEYQVQFYEADEDTVFLLKLSEMLNDICDFVKSHICVLEHRVDIEDEIRANVVQAFEAWKRGLCPVLMHRVQRYVKADSMNFWETYDEVAKFLNSKQMSYEATQKAIREWQLSREKLMLSA